MDEGIREGSSRSCECAFCSATVRIAFYLSQGDLVYCEECGEAYIVSNCSPLRLQQTSERQMDTPWLDGSYFI